MAVVMRIRSSEFKAHIHRATAEGLQRAGVFLHGKCVQAVNKSNTHRHVAKFTASQRAKRGGQKTGTVYENMHNAFAGQPPFKRSGFGQQNVAYEYNGDPNHPVVRVGARKNAAYMIFLEVGTRRILARPWLLAMLKKYRAEIGRLACSGGRR
jgi:hypothetical protein